MPFGCFKKEKAPKTPKDRKKKVSATDSDLEASALETSTARSPRTPTTPGKTEVLEKSAPSAPVERKEEDLASSESSSAPEPLPYVIGQMSPRPPVKPAVVTPLAVNEVARTPVKKDTSATPPSSAHSHASARSPRGGSFSSDRQRTSSISAGDWTKIRAETDQKLAENRPAILTRKMTLAAEMAIAAAKAKEAEGGHTEDEMDLDALDDLDLDAVAVEVETFREEDYNEQALEDKLLEQAVVAQIEVDVALTKRELAHMQDSDGSHDLADLDDLHLPSDFDMASEEERDLDPLDENSDSEVEVPPATTKQATPNPKLGSHLSTHDEHSTTEDTHTDQTPRQHSDMDLSLSTTTPRHNHQASLQDEDDISPATTPRAAPMEVAI